MANIKPIDMADGLGSGHKNKNHSTDCNHSICGIAEDFNIFDDRRVKMGMTVKQLINKLKKYPEDAKIVVDNDECYFDGIYFVTSVEEYEEGTVLIATDYEKRLEDGNE